MKELEDLLGNLKSQILALLARIEETPQVEKLLIAYESLDLRYQKRIAAGSVVLMVILVLGAFLYPLWNVFQAKSLNQKYYQLIGEIQAFNAATNVEYRPAARPLGFSQLPTSPLEDLEISINQFLASIGVLQDLFDVQKNPSGFSVTIEQISIRQVVYLLFQIDGWYPALKFNTLSVNVSQEKDNLLDMKFTLIFDPQEAQSLQNAIETASGTASGFGNVPSSPISQAPDSSPMPPPEFENSSSPYEYNPPPSAPIEDFGSDLPPPPFDEDL